MHFILFYDYVPDYLARRGALREAHLDHVKNFLGRGELVLGGVFADPADGGAILFRAGSHAVPKRFATDDPYVLNGLVTAWRVREWTTVVGRDAEHPL